MDGKMVMPLSVVERELRGYAEVWENTSNARAFTALADAVAAHVCPTTGWTTSVPTRGLFAVWRETPSSVPRIMVISEWVPTYGLWHELPD